MSYYDKYLKYKNKYLVLKQQLGGGGEVEDEEKINNLIKLYNKNTDRISIIYKLYTTDIYEPDVFLYQNNEYYILEYYYNIIINLLKYQNSLSNNFKNDFLLKKCLLFNNSGTSYKYPKNTTNLYKYYNLNIKNFNKYIDKFCNLDNNNAIKFMEVDITYDNESIFNHYIESCNNKINIYDYNSKIDCDYDDKIMEYINELKDINEYQTIKFNSFTINDSNILHIFVSKDYIKDNSQKTKKIIDYIYKKKHDINKELINLIKKSLYEIKKSFYDLVSSKK